MNSLLKCSQKLSILSPYMEECKDRAHDDHKTSRNDKKNFGFVERAHELYVSDRSLRRKQQKLCNIIINAGAYN